MYGLKKLLEEEEARLTRIMKEVDSRLQNAPEGSLRITSSKNKVQYMHCTNEDERSRQHGIYIKKNELTLAKALAQKEYDLKLQRLVKRRLNQISKINSEYKDDEIDDIYLIQHPQRQAMIIPAEKSWEQRVAEWKAKPYEKKGFRPGDPEIYTKEGERVRSKSEKILADTFNDYGIIYKYECPLHLNGGIVLYPDFTFLNRSTYEEVYWEHDGRMSDPEYAENAVKKINTYIRNGILPGKQLILTFESTNNVLNDKVVKEMIKEYL